VRLVAASAIDVAIVMAIALLATSLLRRRSAALRHWILAAAIAAAALMPVFEAVLPVWNLPLLSAPIPETSIVVTVEGVQPIAGSIPATSGANASRSFDRWDLVVIAVWMSGLIAALVVLASGILRLRVLIHRASRVTEPSWHDLVRATANAYGLTVPIRMLYSSHPTPVSLGWWRPTILLPADAGQWESQRIQVVLHHELAHVARRDWPIQMAGAVLCCLHWFNPLAWMAYRVLRRESERACDDLVLRSGVDATDYATHLLAMARHAGSQATLWSPATAMAHASMLEERIQAMLDNRLNRVPLTMRARVATAAILALLVVPVAAFTADARSRNGAATKAQQGGSIVGVLYDQHNGLLPDAEVVLTEDRTGTTLTARSDQSGSFEFRDLPAGDYTLVTALPGFARVKNLIRVAPGAAVKRNITMPLGRVQETISVRSDGTASTSRSGVRPTREIPEPRVPTPCVGRIGGCIKTPRKVLDVRPIYPPGLAVAGVGGEVVLEGRIGIDGYMSDIRVAGLKANELEFSPASGMPHPDLVAAAVEAVRQWEFNPTLLNGVPVEVGVTITVRFNTR
jgi:TonB family protein